MAEGASVGRTSLFLGNMRMLLTNVAALWAEGEEEEEKGCLGITCGTLGQLGRSLRSKLPKLGRSRAKGLFSRSVNRKSGKMWSEVYGECQSWKFMEIVRLSGHGCPRGAFSKRQLDFLGFSWKLFRFSSKKLLQLG
uniref:Uncharacterized protein n=1 Tax=Micrurus carvalhoi TaxID=3147026 RepID=A0A2H6NCU6_9SAUR